MYCIFHYHSFPLYQQSCQQDPKRANATRKFLVVEGVYMNTGNVCTLPQLVELRKQYKLRLFLDESVSFGTLGSQARGITDHFDIPVCVLF